MELAAMNIAFGTKAFSLAPATGFPKQEWELLWSSLFRKNTGKIVVTSLYESDFFAVRNSSNDIHKWQAVYRKLWGSVVRVMRFMFVLPSQNVFALFNNLILCWDALIP